MDPVLRKIDSRWLCMRSFVLNAGKIFMKHIGKMKEMKLWVCLILTFYLEFDVEIAEFFFIDTTPMIDMYFNEPKDHTYDWRGVTPRKKYIANILKV